MAVSKVVYGGETLIDLSGDTVDAAHLASGYTAHDKAGNAVVGTMESGGGMPAAVTAGETPVKIARGTVRITGATYQDTGLSLTMTVPGTYRFQTGAVRQSASGTYGVILYKNGVALSETENMEWDSYCQNSAFDLACAAGDVIAVYAKSRGSANGIFVTYLCACIDWDNGF